MSAASTISELREPFAPRVGLRFKHNNVTWTVRAIRGGRCCLRQDERPDLPGTSTVGWLVLSNWLKTGRAVEVKPSHR